MITLAQLNNIMDADLLEAWGFEEANQDVDETEDFNEYEGEEEWMLEN